MTTPVRLVVGLGNPRPSDSTTRHNVGFWFVDALAQRHSVSFSTHTKFKGMVCELPAGELHAHKIRLLKPQTYMNLSGESVLPLARYFNIAPEEILVAHDEADLAIGQVKLKHGGGAAGHNGVSNISQHLATRDYWRLRIGIGKPAAPRRGISDYVLQTPPAEEREQITTALARTLAHWQTLAAGNYEQAMHELHTTP